MRCHIVLSIELLVADGAGVGLPLQMRGDIVPVEVARVGVGIVAHLAAVSVAVLDAEAANADWIGAVVAVDPGLGVQTGQLCLHLLLELVGHQVRGRRGGRVLLTQPGRGGGQAARLDRRFHAEGGEAEEAQLQH